MKVELEIEISDDQFNALVLEYLEIQVEGVLDQLEKTRREGKNYSGYYSNDRKIDRSELKKDLKALTRVIRIYS